MWKHRYKPEDFSYGVIPYCIIDEQISYLLVQHRAGHWAFPKWHMEQGESKIQAATRELQEETWIRSDQYTINDPEKRYTENYKFLYRGASVRKTVQYVLWTCSEELTINIQEAELQDARWCWYDEALWLISFDAGKKLLQTIHHAV